MNVKRGLLRVWIVLSLAWWAGGAVMTWSDGWSIYQTEYVYGPSIDTFKPIEYSDLDYFKEAVKRGLYIQTAFADGSTLMTANDQKLADLSPRFLAYRHALKASHFWETVREYSPGVLLPPFVVLLLAYVIAWIVAGFRRDGRQHESTGG